MHTPFARVVFVVISILGLWMVNVVVERLRTVREYTAVCQLIAPTSAAICRSQAERLVPYRWFGVLGDLMTGPPVQPPEFRP